MHQSSTPQQTTTTLTPGRMAESENEILVEDNEPLGESGDPGVSFSAWIYSNYFEFVREKDERNISVKCKLCCAVPGRKTRELSTAKKSTSNLKKHLEKVHPNAKLKLTWKRKADDAGTSSNLKQQKLDFTGPARTERLEPKEVRRLVAEYIVEDMKPLSTVESPAFRTLVGKIPVKTDKILSSPDFSCRMNFPDPSRPVSVKQEEPEDLSNIPYLSPLLANMNPVVVLHELPLNMVRQALHPPAHLQQCSSDEEENVNHSDTCWEPKDDGGNNSDSDWSHSKSRSNGKKQKKGRKLNKDVPSTTQTSQPNTNDILHMVVCKEEVSPEQEQSPSLLQEEPEPPHIKEEQEELLQRPEEPDGSMLTLLAVKSEVDDEDISSHCYEVEVKVEPDTEVTEDGDDLEETSGGVRSHSSQIQSFSCSECPCAFTSQIWLHKHIRWNHKKKPFHCNQCDKSFGEPRELMRHQFVHNVEKPFLCKQCCKRYTHSDGLKRHQLDTSHGEKRFYCTLCKRIFGVPCALKIHQIVHTGEKLKPFHCKDCDHGWTGHLAYRARFAQSAEPSTHCLPLPSTLVS